MLALNSGEFPFFYLKNLIEGIGQYPFCLPFTNCQLISSRISHLHEFFSPDTCSTDIRYLPKFPRETRTAMSIILSNKNSSISCKLCREKFRKTQLSHIETQTSPQISQHEFVREETPTLPCPKNLLCERGYHQGRCEESVRRKLTVVCDEHCDCRENRMVNGCECSYFKILCRRCVFRYHFIQFYLQMATNLFGLAKL